MSKSKTEQFLKTFKSHKGDMPIGTMREKSAAQDIEKLAKTMAANSASSYATKNEEELAANMEYGVKSLLEQLQKDGKLATEQDVAAAQTAIDEMAQSWVSDDLNEASATLFYDDNKTPTLIGEYDNLNENDISDDFTLTYVKTDAWRGYYDIKPNQNWKLLHTDNILSMSEDEKNLKKFDDELQAELRKKGIHYVRAFTRSSNVFSTGYDFFVESGKEKEAKKVAEDLAKKYRDPEAYSFTALTGKDPSEAKPEDKVFHQEAKKILAGQTPTPKEELIKQVQKEKSNK